MSRFCPNCGSLGADDANVCGNCGYRFAQPAQPVQPAYQQPAYQRPAQPAYQQPVQQPAYQRPVQQSAYQQPVQKTYQQPAYQPNTYMPNPIAQGQGFPKSKIFVIIATLLQIFASVIYFFDSISLELGSSKEAFSFMEYMEDEGGEFLVAIPLIAGLIALILNLLTICTKKFGRYIRQIPQMVLALVNFGFYSFLVFALRDQIGYYDYYKELIEDLDGKYSDGFGLMVVIFIVSIALMITAAVFQGKEKKEERAAMRGF